MKSRDTRNLLHTTTPIQTGNQSSLSATSLPDGGGFFAIKNGVLRWYRRHLKKTYYIDFTQDGKQRTRYYWEDLRFPATQIKVNPVQDKPNFDYSYVGYLFDFVDKETLYLIAQMPHSWAIGTPIRPHVHWCPTSTASGNVYWELEYSWANIGDAFPAFAPLYVLDAADGTTHKHQIASFDEIDGAGKGLSSILSLKLSRDPNQEAISYAADALLKEFDIHYQIDGLGSEQELIKLNL